MLGELIYELRGKTIGRRVLGVKEGRPTLEVSVEIEGKLLDASFKGSMTYVAESRPDGVLHGHGQGVMVTEDGELITLIGFGAARPGRDRKVRWRGCNFCETSSSKYSRLNGMAGVFEHDEDEEGKIINRMWEWR